MTVEAITGQLMLILSPHKRSPYLLWFCVLTTILFSGICFASQPASEPDIQRLRENVLALDQVQHNIHQEIQLRQISSTISRSESNELLIFASYLQGRNRDYCKQLSLLGGEAAKADLPCPAEQAELPVVTAKTTDEELAELEESLTESLGAFDEMLLGEQERIAARQPRQRESGDDAGSADTAAGSKPGQQATGSQQHGRSGTTRNSGGPGQAESRSGNVNRTKQEGMHADDDIVARQLREAAEKETNPELKEKLWNEYRKYKSGK